MAAWKKAILNPVRAIVVKTVSFMSAETDNHSHDPGTWRGNIDSGHAQPTARQIRFPRINPTMRFWLAFPSFMRKIRLMEIYLQLAHAGSFNRGVFYSDEHLYD